MIEGARAGVEQATVVDLHVAGAGLETTHPLVPGEELSITLATPTMWDPLVVTAVVRWARSITVAEPPIPGRPRAVARAGVAFDYPSPAVVLSMFAMLTTLDYE